jgi:hypothetical protein
MDKNDRRRARASFAQFDDVLAQAPNFDEAPARRVRPADQPCANEGDERADGENDGDDGERVHLF